MFIMKPHDREFTTMFQLFIWDYKRTGEASSPTIVLKTRRSLRAVHFHPHGAPLLLTAEVRVYIWASLSFPVFSFLSRFVI